MLRHGWERVWPSPADLRVAALTLVPEAAPARYATARIALSAAAGELERGRH